ncbi:MAG TPA: MipA/OmpV family protein [Gammaproteobacteria bacterium]|nr:MipA/OmpV family protein [Gammaproteobacteria bacterium]
MQIPPRLTALLAGLLAAFASCGSRADTPPAADNQSTHVELGIGLGGAHFADYPGASRYWNLLLPLPYVTLKSPHLDANRDGVHGKLLKGDSWSLNVDFGGSVPVDSSRDVERHGMPDLGWIAETGPILRYRPWRNRAAGLVLEMSLAARIAASVDGLELHHRGWVTEPKLELMRNWGNGDNHYHADVGVSWSYATNDYFNYVYGVAPQYADAGRPVYRAGGGYGGYSISLGFGMRHGDMIYGAFYRHINLAGASFNGSPLVSQRHQNAFGFAVAWVFRHIDD